MNTSHEQMLKQALEAFRDGDTQQARALIEQVLDQDETNAKAWLLLYRISDSLDEKRVALVSALEYDPGNEKARQALERLNARMGIESEDEIAPGISRRQVALIFGGILLVSVIVIGGVIALIASNNQQASAAIATQTAFALAPSQTQAAFLAQTQVVIDGTLTQEALVSPTPTPTETLIGPPTLPPTFTPTPLPTVPITPTPLSPPPGIGGVIYGWGGADLANDGYLRVVSLRVDGGGVAEELNVDTTRGRFVSAARPNEIFYDRILPETFSNEIFVLDLQTRLADALASRWMGVQNDFDDSTMPHVSADGRQVVFVARALDTGTFDVYIYDSGATTGNPVRRITSDNRNYSFPAFSPDATQIIVTRKDTNGPTNQDLYLIDLLTLQQTPFTTDGDATYEEMARWSPDGQIIAYVARNAPNANGDIMIRPLSGFTGALNITNSTGDDIHPVFSPDGRYIAYSSTQRAFAHQIYIYDANTGAVYQLTTEPLASYYAGAWLDR